MLLLFFPFLVLYFITQKIVFLYATLAVLGIAVLGHVVDMIFGGIGTLATHDTTHDIIQWTFAIVAALVVFFIMKG